MSCSARENCNVFWSLFTLRIADNSKLGTKLLDRKYKVIWYGKRLLRLRWWRYNYKYAWHDSVGKFWNRLIKCNATGHLNMQDIACDGELPRTYCFDCERYIDD